MKTTIEEVKKLVRPNIAALKPYSTARDEYEGEIGIYLDANENPYENGFNRYPDPRHKALRARISEIKGVPMERIFTAGSGSDEIIDLLYRIFCTPGWDNVVSIAPSYGVYSVSAAINDVEFREVRLNADFTMDPDAVLDAVDGTTSMIFVCSPNNPSGNLIPTRQIEYLLENFPGVVVVDEAYIDFAPGQSMLSKLDQYDNLVVLHTLSKAWGMAGLRIGMGFAHPYIVETMMRVKAPYNMNSLTQATVLKMLESDPAAQVAELVAQRDLAMEKIKTMPGVLQMYPSDANFVLIKVQQPRAIYDRLIESGVIVRDRSRIPGCEGCLRITIGTPQENASMLAALENILS